MMRNGNGGLKGIQKVGFAATTSPNSPQCVRFPTRCSSAINDYAVLGLGPLSSKSDVKRTYKRLALKYHPDVLRTENAAEKHVMFREIKSAYESLMQKFEEEEEELQEMKGYDEFDEWDEWMGFEGGIPALYNF
ncbi:hypothetical protein Nepgr_002178 [Nepenthes gracilis]|uniref:J domain-containing protein n=1 Tax=Nepenthes gracilis TaxID=150966 RepID=A0AAD3P9C5_NEPGR|nr:hypothetical protein Nepgr_002178 [Nepenthes gracilis]